MAVTAVIAAAGSGERLGAGRPKALVEIAGRPLFEWSLEAIRASTSIDAIVLAAPAGEEAAFARPEVRVVAGGASRSESVAAAVAGLEGEIVVVHDAARPLAPAGLFDEVIAMLEGEASLAGVVAAAPCSDTIKRAGGDGRVTQTLERAGLWAVQTPQAFRLDVLRAAQGAPSDVLAAASDDAALVEAAGGAVAICPAPPRNLKVTSSDDLRVAEALIVGRA